MRLDALLTRLGVGTRSQCQRMIRSGQVTVGGMPVRDPSCTTRSGAQITVNGHTLDTRLERTYMLYKPEGVLTAAADKKARTVMDLMPPACMTLSCMPVGRLDKDTTGLLLLSTDGELAHRLISPRYEINKVYQALSDTPFTEDDVRAFADGLELSDFKARPALLEITEPFSALITVSEGKYHQVRRMLASRGHKTLALHRLKIGPLSLDPTLEPGQNRELDENELSALRKAVNLP